MNNFTTRTNPTLLSLLIKSQTRAFSSSTVNHMIIKPVPCLQDNYAYILLDEKSKTAAVVDPVEPNKVLDALEENYPDYKLTTILTTHHHWDHAGGNNKLLKKRPGLTVYGGSDKVQGVTNLIDSEEQQIRLGDLDIQPYLTRGHTMDHVSYYIKNKDQSAVFTGDCLFSSGCGRFFEGSPRDVHEALTKLISLPEKTTVYFGHEYTLSNCEFAIKIEPHNSALQKKLDWARRVGCTTPTTLLNESLTNPFLRVHEATVRQAVLESGENASSLSDIDVLGRLRQMKDSA